MTDTKTLVAVIGAGGAGREVMPLVEVGRQSGQTGEQELVFVTEDEGTVGEVNGYRVISKREFLAHKGPSLFNVAIADAGVRRRLAAEMIAAGSTPLAIVSRDSVNLGHAKIGEGAIICPYSAIMPNSRVGRFFHCNYYSTVSHDVQIGDFVTFAPRVSCNGGVIIEDDVYVGTGAIIRHAEPHRPIVIGKGAVIGMGAVVTRSVPAHAVVFGNPARIIRDARPR